MATFIYMLELCRTHEALCKPLYRYPYPTQVQGVTTTEDLRQLLQGNEFDFRFRCGYSKPIACAYDVTAIKLLDSLSIEYSQPGSNNRALEENVYMWSQFVTECDGTLHIHC